MRCTRPDGHQQPRRFQNASFNDGRFRRPHCLIGQNFDEDHAVLDRTSMKTMPSFSIAPVSLPEVSSRRHRGRFLFDDQSSKFAFSKLPGRWHQLIDNLCINLGKETPGTRGFRINMDRTMREAEARASQSAAIPADETPEQRKRTFQEALHEVLRVCQDRGSSNKNVWAEALHLLDNPWVRVSN